VRWCWNGRVASCSTKSHYPDVFDDDALVRVQACGLAPDSMVLPVPAALDAVLATVFNPLGAGIRWGATIPGTGPGEVVAVFGADLVADVAVDDPVAALRDATGGLADVVVDVTAKAPAAFAQAIELLASGRYPFADLPRRCVGLDAAEDLLATMAGERDDVPPVHGVVTP
jgi:alcohol dehydrogenase